MAPYSATYNLFSSVGGSSHVYSYKKCDDYRGLREAKVQAERLRKAFGEDVRVRLSSVVNRETGEFLFHDFEESSRDIVPFCDKHRFFKE